MIKLLFYGKWVKYSVDLQERAENHSVLLGKGDKQGKNVISPSPQTLPLIWKLKG